MRIAIYLFQRNEEYLLRRWIPYHAGIAGLENIHIVDHHSDSKTCLDLLQTYEQQGMHLYHTQVEFRKKSRILTRIMDGTRNLSDILIPLDADEFLCATDTNSNTMLTDPEEILNRFSRLCMDGKKYAFNVYTAIPGQFKYSDPLTEMTSFHFYRGRENADGPNQLTKTFFPAANFLYTDQGNHKGRVILGPNDQYHTTPLSLAHFHMRGLNHFKQKMEKAVEAYSLDNLPQDYVGSGMRWNRWRKETNGLTESELRNWFRKNFVPEQPVIEENALSNRLITMANSGQIL